MSIKHYAYNHAAQAAGIQVTEVKVGDRYRVLRPGHHLDGKIGTLEYISGDDGHLQFSDCAICGTPLSTLQAMKGA